MSDDNTDENTGDNLAPDNRVSEVLGAQSEPGTRSRGGRRTALIVGVAVLVAGLLGGSAFAVYRAFFDVGPAVETVLPADTLAVVSIDLNPGAKQKIEAIKTIRKFPGLREELDLETEDDLRKVIFDRAIGESGCEDLDYEQDIEPWLGKRAGFAVVGSGATEPTPVLAVQITDEGKAVDGIKQITACADPGEDFGYATTEDFLLISDSTEHAKQVVSDAAEKSLVDDAAYEKWTDEVGDAGVLNFYVSRAAGEFLLENGGEMFGQPLGEGEETEMFEEYLDEFAGLAGTVRFADGGMELAAVTSASKGLAGTGRAGQAAGELPGDTAAVLGFSVPEDYVQSVLDGIESSMGEQVGSMLEEAEAQTGLSLPEDLQTLLGDSLTIALGGDAPESFDAIAGPTDVQAGLLIHGEPDGISGVIDKVEERTGFALSDIPLAHEQGDDAVALATTPDFAKALLEGGDLASNGTFGEAVPEHDSASGLLFVDFDSAWFDLILAEARADAENDEDARMIAENLEPLDALGLSGWVDGDRVRALVKLSTN